MLTAISKVQSVGRKVSVFVLFVDNVNAPHEEWLGSSTTTLQGRAACDFASSSGCEQMVTDPTYINGGFLDLMLTSNQVTIILQINVPVQTF